MGITAAVYPRRTRQFRCVIDPLRQLSMFSTLDFTSHQKSNLAVGPINRFVNCERVPRRRNVDVACRLDALVFASKPLRGWPTGSGNTSKATCKH